MTLTRSTCSHSVIEISSNGRISSGEKIPALLIRTSAFDLSAEAAHRCRIGDVGLDRHGAAIAARDLVFDGACRVHVALGNHNASPAECNRLGEGAGPARRR